MSESKGSKVPDGCPLAPRQFQVLDLLAQGFTRQQIARKLSISESTIRTTCHTAYHKLGVANGPQAVAMMGQMGWVGWKPPPPPPKLHKNSFAKKAPFLHAYIDAFEKWLRTKDDRYLDAMRIALAGHRKVFGKSASDGT